MPCFCWTSDNNLEPEMTEIRNHIKDVVRLVHSLNSKGDFSQEGSALPRSLLKDVHTLLDDLYKGKCSEVRNE